ncbi:MAG: chemotaxis protein CheX [Symbiobacterium sp.]|jgi:CheC-like family.|uniref:chemotaxis protein CheX n=1 Tax=Symbiobacterium sp. TaxID=1971213 RepID=UPI0034639DCF
MKAEVVNAFLAAAKHNLAQELKSEIKRTGLRVEASAHVTDEVVIYLSFVGQVRGSLLLGLNLATARTIAATMVSEPMEELTEMGLSALAELGNLVAGGACTELEKIGLSADITPPTIMIGPQTRISTLGVSRVVVPLACQHGRLNLHLSIDVAA